MFTRARLVLIGLASAGLLTVGCGSDSDSDSATAVDVNQIVKAAEKDQRARVRITADVSGGGLKKPLKVNADGTMSLTDINGDLAVESGPITDALGVPAATVPKQVRLVFTPRSIAVEVPKAFQATITGGKPWVGASLKGAGGATASGLAAVLGITVAQAAPVYEKAELKPNGTEKLNGVETTRFAGDISIAEVLSVLPKDQQSAAKKLFSLGATAIPKEDLERSEPIEIWVDSTGRIHRQTTTNKLGKTEDNPAGTITLRMDFSEFGTAPEIQAPASGDIFDASDVLRQSLSASSSGSAA